MASPRILVVDDEADLRELVEITLVRMGLDVDSAASLADARRCLAKTEYALVLTDMRLPDGLGIALVQEISSQYKNTPVAVITAFGSADNAVIALKAGAFDYLSKPVGLDQLRTMVQSALKTSVATTHPGNTCENDPVRNGLDSRPLRLRGESSAMQELRAQIVRLARSMAPVAITGESGTGKELAARDIHALSARADKAFIAVNCGAIPEALMEAEFFGYRKGAFTGASEDRDGFFQAANGGTLLLDEVADLPLAMQVKLLRAIQERRVRKVGATVEEPVDVRLISATHQNLAAGVERGTFRQDLFYRLNVIELKLPPLRERKEDIQILADGIVERLSDNGKRTVLSPGAIQALADHTFPGNVRELENILERAMAFANDGTIESSDLGLKTGSPGSGLLGVSASADGVVKEVISPASRATSILAGTLKTESVVPPQSSDSMLSNDEVSEKWNAGANANARGLATSLPVNAVEPLLPLSLVDYLDNVERQIIRRALAKTRFNRTQASELLGLSFRQLRYRMQRLDIHEPE
jgi:two-component system response regulator PilR (NtrC family)